MSTAKKQFMFVHIPKTAGTTFILTLTRYFGRKKKLSFYSQNGRQLHKEMSTAERNTYDLSYGHVPYIENLSIERGIEYFTFLRQPRERLLSSYRHIKLDYNHGLNKQINVAEYSLKDFLQKGPTRHFDNLMVRYISGSFDKAYLEINETDLQLAIKNFDERFHIFGLTEYFDESLVLLSNYMGWLPLYYVKENKSAFKIDPKELDEETEKLILRCNRYDQQLYDHALKRFLKMMEEKKEILQKGLVELRQGSAKRRTIILLRNKAGLLYSIFKRKIS